MDRSDFGVLTDGEIINAIRINSERRANSLWGVLKRFDPELAAVASRSELDDYFFLELAKLFGVEELARSDIAQG